MPESEYDAQVINSFALKAFTYRKPTDTFLSTLSQLYRENRSKGMSIEKAIQEPLAVILASPKFLYLVEGSPASNTVLDWELASRLSYFLWSSRPDFQLFKLDRKSVV